MKNKKLGGLAVFAALLVFCLVLYRDVIFSKDRLLSFCQQDIYNYGFSFDYLAFGSGFKRQINLWNPYLLLGMPLITHPANPLFYPLNLIFFYLPLNVAINYSFVINTLLSGLAIYLYVRYLGQQTFSAFIAAIVFMFNAVMMLHTYSGHLQTLQTLPWIPLLFLFIEMFIRKERLVPAMLGGLVLGIQILAANAQISFYTLIGGTAYFWFFAIAAYFEHKSWRRFIFHLTGYFVLIIIAIGISAVKWIPAIEFLRLSERSKTTWSFVGTSSFYFSDLVTYFLPEIYGDIIGFPHWGLAPNGFWEMCGYVGILPLILSLVAIICRRNKHTAFFAGLLFFACLASLGDRTLFFYLFYYCLPGFNKFRVHARFIILLVFSVSVLCAHGINWLLERKEEKNKNFKQLLWSLGIFLASVISFIILINLKREPALALWSFNLDKIHLFWDFIQGSFSYALFSLAKFAFFLTASFLLLVYWVKKRITAKLFKILIFIIVLSDLWWFGSKYIISERVDKCYWDRKLVNFLKEKGPLYNYRVMSIEYYNTFPNNAILDGIYALDGYEAILMKRYMDLFRLWDRQGMNAPQNIRLLRMCNLRFIITHKEAKFLNPPLKVVYQNDKSWVWENPQYLPRTYIVHGVKIIKNNRNKLRHFLFRRDFRPLDTVVLEEDGPIDTGIESLAQQPGESAEFLKYSNNEVIIKAVLKNDGYLILSDFNYPGWKAFILNLENGELKEVKPLYANYLFRAVGLKPGKYSVRFVYEPQSFYNGLRITALTSLTIILGLIWSMIKRKDAHQI